MRTANPKDASDIDFVDARRRARKVGWAKTAAQLGVGAGWLRRRADPDFREKSRAGETTGDQSGIYLRRTNADIDGAKLLALVRPDTRTSLERLMGIPPKGRSALDKHRAAAARAPKREPRLPYVRFLDPKEQRIKT